MSKNGPISGGILKTLLLSPTYNKDIKVGGESECVGPGPDTLGKGNMRHCGPL